MVTMNNRKKKTERLSSSAEFCDWPKDLGNRRVDFGEYTFHMEPMNLSKKEKRLRKKRYRERFE